MPMPWNVSALFDIAMAIFLFGYALNTCDAVNAHQNKCMKKGSNEKEEEEGEGEEKNTSHRIKIVKTTECRMHCSNEMNVSMGAYAAI